VCTKVGALPIAVVTVGPILIVGYVICRYEGGELRSTPAEYTAKVKQDTPAGSFAMVGATNVLVKAGSRTVYAMVVPAFVVAVAGVHSWFTVIVRV
jgi:hypothetical protein